jgi:hypothetical protein
MIPGFRRDDVLAFRISRVPAVFPIPTLSYSEHLPALAASMPGLYLVSSANIVNGTLNVNETVQLAEDTARWLAGTEAKTRVQERLAAIPEQAHA